METNSNLQKFLNIAGILLRLCGYMIVGVFIGALVTMLLNNLSPEDFQEKLSSFSPENKNLLIQAQLWTQLFWCIILPLIYVAIFDNRLNPIHQIHFNKFGLYTLLGVLILISSFPLIGWLQDVNRAFPFPESLKNLQAWIENKEDQAKKATEILGYYQNTQEFWIGVFVIAVIPGIGEEFLFRGIIQNEFRRVFKNPHVAIWVTGFLFSFIHMQFLGFFPRMLLGVTLGYLYFWSGNLLIPMIVHFMNNFISYLLLNFYKQKMIAVDPETAESIPAYVIITSIIVFLLLLFTFKKFRINPSEELTHS